MVYPVFAYISMNRRFIAPFLKHHMLKIANNAANSQARIQRDGVESDGNFVVGKTNQIYCKHLLKCSALRIYFVSESQ